MGCYGSRQNNTTIEHNPVYHHIDHRFSTCNGRITRIIQEEQVDYCECEDSEYELPIDYNYSPCMDVKRSDKEWQISELKHTELRGRWVCGISAGGSRNNIELFATNPQYELQIISEHKDAKIDVTISLMLLNFVTKQTNAAFFIYDSEGTGQSLDAEHFFCTTPIYTTGAFKRRPVISGQVKLNVGIYVIVAALFHAHHDNEFIISACTADDATLVMTELDIHTEPTIYFLKKPTTWRGLMDCPSMGQKFVITPNGAAP